MSLSSWNEAGTKQKILNFVTTASYEISSDYRIATFMPALALQVPEAIIAFLKGVARSSQVTIMAISDKNSSILE